MELGVRFRSDISGYITAIRFYKSLQNTGVHVGNLWSNSGTLLSTATFTNESASGWQQVDFPCPVPIVVNTTYVASYHTNTGHYSYGTNYFLNNGVDSPPLHALKNGQDGPNGVYAYGSSSSFPTNVYQANNYWVDVVFTPYCPGLPNAIACENALPGAPSMEWNVTDHASIRGFTTAISTNVGGTVRFKIDTTSTNYRIDIYRLGYYGDNGARKVATIPPSVALPQVQPACHVESNTGLTDCGKWDESATWEVPSTAVSGVYQAVLRRLDAQESSPVLFVIRKENSTSDLLLQTSDTTCQAYNNYGGRSLYGGTGSNYFTLSQRAYKVSYNRPVVQAGIRCGFFDNEHPMIRWLERNGYDVSYTTGVDTHHQDASILQKHKVFVSSGHDEYWSAQQRTHVEAARNAGVNLAFFSGNEMFWKIRWENSNFGGPSGANRTMVSYKETVADAKIDPSAVWTGTWRDPRFSPPSDGGKPENAVTGTLFTINNPLLPGDAPVSLKVPAADGKMRFWRNTPVAQQSAGNIISLGSRIVGFEADEDVDNGFRPAGLVRLSETPFNTGNRLLDFGGEYGPGSVTHRMTMYRVPNGALVFGAGTVRWSWGLDDVHTGGSSPFEPSMRQATANLLADMGAQPSLIPGGQLDVVPASQSTDSTRPTSVIALPAAGATFSHGLMVPISGTASDFGGVVGAVEVSTNGGTTWHPASGRETWTYSWSASGLGTVSIKTRAVDDSGNIEIPSSERVVSVTGPCRMWNNAAIPANTSYPDGASVEVGVKFRSELNGLIKGIRFYKGDSNNTHVVHLWTAGGNELAMATTVNETAGGWQQATFATPVSIAGNTTYVASYHAPQGHYAFDAGYFLPVGRDSFPLNARVDANNGVYQGATNSTFPATESPKQGNYWVDVVFDVASLWAKSTIPSNPSAADSLAVELGVKFRSDFAGFIKGIRFYKGSGNGGTHVGNLWTSSGIHLATATFTSETSSGWQEVYFPSPVAISPNTTYVASYYAPQGHYAFDRYYFLGKGFDNGPLQALGSGVDGPNGVYRYNDQPMYEPTFPTASYQAMNYWVDVIFGP